MSCSSRTFYRGAAFAATDERHAVGATTALPNPTANAAACLSEGGLELLYHASSLAIIHFQVGTRTPTPTPTLTLTLTLTLTPTPTSTPTPTLTRTSRSSTSRWARSTTW